MTANAFAAAKRRLIAGLPPCTGGSREGILIDVAHALRGSTLFTDVVVTKAEDPDVRVRATCRTALPDAPPAAIEAELERIWMDNLRYQRGREVHVICRGERTITLRAATVPQPAQYYVTVTTDVVIR